MEVEKYYFYVSTKKCSTAKRLTSLSSSLQLLFQWGWLVLISVPLQLHHVQSGILLALNYSLVSILPAMHHIYWALGPVQGIHFKNDEFKLLV